MYCWIHDLREEQDLTQTQLAKKLNCSRRVYRYYERGRGRNTDGNFNQNSGFLWCECE